MNPDVLADIDRRLQNLGSTSARYRAGEVTGTSPLDVALGGSSVAYEDVRSLQGGLRIGDQVATLVFGNDILVLGSITPATARGVATATWTATASASGVVTVTHGLPATPTKVFVQAQDTGGPSLVACQPFNVGASTFQFQGVFLSGTWTAGGTHACAWEAHI